MSSTVTMQILLPVFAIVSILLLSSSTSLFAADYSLIRKWGTTGINEGQFNGPADVALDKKNGVIYVSDLDNNRIQKFDTQGKFLDQWGKYGFTEGQFSHPGDIAVDSTGDFVYVSDINNNRIQKFDSDGNFILQFGSPGSGQGEFNHPGDIAVSPEDSDLFVTDIGNSRVEKFDSDGNFLGEWGTFGIEKGQFNRPAGIEFDSLNNVIYVVDTKNDRIQKFDTDGNFLSRFGYTGNGDGQFNRPTGISYDSKGNLLYITDNDNHRVQVFDKNGNFISKWGSQTTFERPTGIAYDPTSKVIYLNDKVANNIQAFALTTSNTNYDDNGSPKSSMAALVNITNINSTDIPENITGSDNTTNINSTDIPENITGSDNSTLSMSIEPFAPSLGDGNNTISTAAVIIERGSSFPDNKKFYTPSNLTIQGNTTVSWTNNDTVLHTITSGDPSTGPSGVFDSSLIGPNNQFNYTFSAEGQFKYYCTLHPFMTGTVTVTKQIQPIVTTPDKLPKMFNVSIAEGSSFPNNRIFFAPPEINVAPNATVVWTNNDSIIHSVTSGKPREAPTGEFDSGIIQPTNTFNHTFSKTGTYDYYSNIHPYMVGKIIVGLYTYNLQIDNRTYPISFLLTGNGNQIQKIRLQTLNPTLELRLISASPGNLTLVIPRALLDKLEPNGMDDAFGVVANRAVGFEETSTTPTSRTLVLKFDPGVNYIQIPGTKSLNPISKYAAGSTEPNVVPEISARLNESVLGISPAANRTGSQILVVNQTNPETDIPRTSSVSTPSLDKIAIKMKFEQQENGLESYNLKDFTLAVNNNSRMCPEQHCKFEFEETSLNPTLPDYGINGMMKIDKGDVKKILGIYSSFRPTEEREENGQKIETVEGTFRVGKEPVNEADYTYNMNGTLLTAGREKILSLQGIQCTAVSMTNLSIISDCNY